MDASALNVMAVTGKRLGFVLNNSLGAMAAPLVSKAKIKKKKEGSCVSHNAHANLSAGGYVLFNLVRLALHQKLIEPSPPPVAKVPCALKAIAFTGYS